MDRHFKFFLYILLFSPVLAFFVANAGISEYRYFLRPVFWGVCFFWFVAHKNRIRIPSYLFYLMGYILFKGSWDLYNYYTNQKEFAELFRKPHIEILLILLMIENSFFDDKFIRSSLRILKITLWIALGFSFIQLFVDPMFFYHTDFEDAQSTLYQIRRQSVFSYIDENSLGFDFLPLFAVLLGMALHNKENFGFIVLSATIISFSSNTRYIMVGYLVVLFQILVYSKFRLSQLIKYSLMFILAGTVLFYFLQFAGYNLEEYISERIFPEKDITKSTRFFAFEIFQQFFHKNMWIGTGQHLTNEIEAALEGYSSQIHVGYLSHLVSYGIVGSFFLFMFWFKLLSALFKDAKLSGYYGSVFAFLVFLWSNMTLVYYSIFTYGLIMSFVYSKYMRDKYFMFKPYRGSLQTMAKSLHNYQ
jgi:hypothetical protein